MCDGDRVVTSNDAPGRDYFEELRKILYETYPERNPFRRLQEECEHKIYHKTEENDWCYCVQCKEWLIDFEMVSEPENALQVYTQPYNNVNNFMKYLTKVLDKEKIINIELEPMKTGFIQFPRAYSQCTFVSRDKVVGKTRNFLGIPFTIYKIAGLLAINNPQYRVLVEGIRKYLPKEKRLQILNGHWKQLESHLPCCWQSTEPKHERRHPIIRRKPCVQAK